MIALQFTHLVVLPSRHWAGGCGADGVTDVLCLRFEGGWANRPFLRFFPSCRVNVRLCLCVCVSVTCFAALAARRSVRLRREFAAGGPMRRR